MFIAVLIRVQRGSKYKLLLRLSALLLISNISLLVLTIEIQLQFLEDKVTTSGLWIINLAFGLWLSSFNVAHCILAWQYS